MAWNQFRGASATAYVPQVELPTEWADTDYRWQVPLPGIGVGSPVIFNDRVYLLNAEPEIPSRSIVAIDLESGKVIWQTAAPLKPHHLHSRSTFASSTPFVDASGVYVAWGDPDRVTLAALNHDGEFIWQRDLGTWQSQHGFGVSPVIHEGKLILFNSQQAEQLNPGEKAGKSRMMAFDPKTGETLWSTDLTTTRACYGVPALYKSPSGQSQLVGANTGNGLFALDLNNGSLLWSVPVFDARCVSSPLVTGDLAIGSAGSGGGGNHLVAVRIGDATSQTAPTEHFRLERFAPYVPTPAVVDDRLYMVDDKGFASCLMLVNGQLLWNGRLSGNYSASPVVIGNKMLVVNLEGKATTLAIGDRFEPLASFELGGPVQATPSFAGDSIIFRIGNTISCLPLE